MTTARRSLVVRLAGASAARRLAAGVIAVSAVVLGTGAAPVAASSPAVPAAPQIAAAEAAWLRLAHLSPDAPQVDIYLTSYSRPDRSLVLRGIGYGAVSAYQRAGAGMYTVAMRTIGSSPDSTPILRSNITVEPQRAYTVAGVGRADDLQIKVLSDDLTAPARGTARARVVQASYLAPEVDVVSRDGTTIAQNAKFATMTGYADVAAKPWLLKVVPKNGKPTSGEITVNATPGAVYTLFVLDKGDTVTLVARNDSAGAAAPPRGGVDAGAGTLDAIGGSGSASSSAVMTVLLVGGVVGVAFARSRRRRTAHAG